jgi:hypothetical protein
MKLFEYTGTSGQKVGFGLVETGQVYAVTDELAPILASDSEFKELTGKAAEGVENVLPASPEPPSFPPGVSEAPPVEEAAEEPAGPTLDEQIVAYKGAAPEPAKPPRRSRTKSP